MPQAKIDEMSNLNITSSLWQLQNVYIVGDKRKYIDTVTVFKDIENLAIILVPLIMILSRGHTGQIKD